MDFTSSSSSVPKFIKSWPVQVYLGFGKLASRLLVITDELIFSLDPNTSSVPLRQPILSIQRFSWDKVSQSLFRIIFPNYSVKMFLSPYRSEILHTLAYRMAVLKKATLPPEISEYIKDDQIDGSGNPIGGSDIGVSCSLSFPIMALGSDGVKYPHILILHSKEINHSDISENIFSNHPYTDVIGVNIDHPLRFTIEYTDDPPYSFQVSPRDRDCLITALQGRVLLYKYVLRSALHSHVSQPPGSNITVIGAIEEGVPEDKPASLPPTGVVQEEKLPPKPPIGISPSPHTLVGAESQVMTSLQISREDHSIHRSEERMKSESRESKSFSHQRHSDRDRGSERLGSTSKERGSMAEVVSNPLFKTPVIRERSRPSQPTISPSLPSLSKYSEGRSGYYTEADVGRSHERSTRHSQERTLHVHNPPPESLPQHPPPLPPSMSYERVTSMSYDRTESSRTRDGTASRSHDDDG
ncbi:hypothetical protein ADUPG1_012619, partial [Aduncisulcus paluster]